MDEGNFSMNDLDEALLIEILYRVPSAKSAIICKSVCKRWYFLISTPYFVHCFTKYGETKFGNQQRYALVLNYQGPNQCLTMHVRIASNDPNSVKGGEFPFPCLPEEKGHVCVVGSCNDLLLCWARVGDFRSFYICNPFTMQWQALPSIPWRVKDKLNNHNYRYSDILECAFVCDSNHTDGFRFDYRFRVMVLLKKDRRPGYYSKKYVKFGIYCSETHEWDEYIFRGKQYWLQSNIVPFNGKLHWYNGVNIVVYDPFNIIQQVVFIDVSTLDMELQEFYPASNVWFLGVCRGLFRAMVLTRKRYNSDYVDIPTSLLVFELENYNARIWSLKHKVCLDTMVSKVSWVQNYVRFGFYSTCKLLACHPTDDNIVYLDFWNQVISCNLFEGELELDGNIPPKNHCGNLYTLEPSLWPTTVFA